MEATRTVIKIEIQNLRNKKIEEKKFHKVVKREVENSRRCKESVKTIHSLLVINRVLFISFQTALTKPNAKAWIHCPQSWPRGLVYLQLIYWVNDARDILARADKSSPREHLRQGFREAP